MSQEVGSPFMLETMFRSGVPPHMGQSPLPGSDADTRQPAITGMATTNAARILMLMS
jgi:hypothetical protein